MRSDRLFRSDSGNESGRVSQEELQQDIQRLVGTFMERYTQASETALVDATPDETTKIMKQALRFEAAALEIATGPVPELNWLDILVFFELGHNVVERYWIPEVFGERGRPLLEAFARSRDEAWDKSSKFLEDRQKRQLRDIIAQWERDNPDQVLVAGVRLFDFSGVTTEVARRRSQEARGLLRSVRTATQAADRALLVAERALFLAQRTPFLLRVQARLGANEIAGDAMSRLGEVDALVQQVDGLRPLLEDASSLARQVSQMQPLLAEASSLVENSTAAVREAEALMGAVEPLLATRTTEGEPRATTALEEIIPAANELAVRTEAVLHDARTILPQAEDTWSTTSKRMDTLVRRWIIYALVAGTLLIVVFWGGYYASRRLVLAAESSHAQRHGEVHSERPGRREAPPVPS